MTQQCVLQTEMNSKQLTHLTMSGVYITMSLVMTSLQYVIFLNRVNNLKWLTTDLIIVSLPIQSWNVHPRPLFAGRHLLVGHLFLSFLQSTFIVLLPHGSGGRSTGVNELNPGCSHGGGWNSSIPVRQVQWGFFFLLSLEACLYGLNKTKSTPFVILWYIPHNSYFFFLFSQTEPH